MIWLLGVAAYDFEVRLLTNHWLSWWCCCCYHYCLFFHMSTTKPTCINGIICDTNVAAKNKYNQWCQLIRASEHNCYDTKLYLPWWYTFSALEIIHAWSINGVVESSYNNRCCRSLQHYHWGNMYKIITDEAIAQLSYNLESNMVIHRGNSALKYIHHVQLYQFLENYRCKPVFRFSTRYMV